MMKDLTNLAKGLMAYGAAWFQLGVHHRVKLDREVPLEAHGSKQTSYPVYGPALRPGAIVYSLGEGNDIGFDTSLIEKKGAKVYGFDPTEQSARHIASLGKLNGYTFEKIAVGAQDGEVSFSCIFESDEYFAGTVLEGQEATREVRVPMKRLASLMAQHGHKHIDLLKMDIEGGEYSLLPDLLASGVRPSQIVLEFHPYLLNPSQGHSFYAEEAFLETWNLINQLRKEGYWVCHQSLHSEFLFIHRSVLENSADPALQHASA